MEDQHHKRLKTSFGPLLQSKVIHVLDVPDVYRFMDRELIDQVPTAADSVLGLEVV